MLSLLRNYIVNIFKLRSLVDDSGKGDRNREIVDFDGESFPLRLFFTERFVVIGRSTLDETGW